MAQEARSTPEIVSRQLRQDEPVYRELGARLRVAPPPSVVTIARGSSDHAAGYLGYLVMTLASFYFLYMQGATGATPGKKLTGLRVLGVQTGRPIGGWLGIVRNIAHVVDALICYIGFLFPLWDEKRQTLADKIMGTVVISNQPKQPFGPEIFTI